MTITHQFNCRTHAYSFISNSLHGLYTHCPPNQHQAPPFAISETCITHQTREHRLPSSTMVTKSTHPSLQNPNRSHLLVQFQTPQPPVTIPISHFLSCKLIDLQSHSSNSLITEPNSKPTQTTVKLLTTPSHNKQSNPIPVCTQATTQTTNLLGLH